MVKFLTSFRMDSVSILVELKNILTMFLNFVDSDQRARVARAIQELQEKTCVRFIPRTNQRNFIEFINNNEGSDSKLS